MNNKPLRYVCFALVTVGYMTLTVSLPLVGAIVKHSTISTNELHYGISLLFFCFSLSAILLSRVAEILTIHKTLLLAQSTSILGLILIACATKPAIFFFAFTLIGSGTGCYSSISRMLLSQLARNQIQLRGFFSTFSLCAITAPVLSSQIALFGHNYHWQAAYLAMCAIEIILLLTLWQLLPRFEQPHNLSEQKKNFFSGYIYCLTKPYFVIAAIITGICAALFYRIIMGNAHSLFLLDFDLSASQFSYITFLLSSFYILGTVALKKLPQQIPGEISRLVGILCFLTTSITLLFLHSAITVALGLCFATFTMGFFGPLNSARGFSVIQHHQGSAAALLTCSFALISACLTLIQNNYTGTMLQFTTNTLVIAAILTTALCALAILIRPRQH